MADQQTRPINSPFPAPPPFWKHFTLGNLSKLEAIKKDAGPSTLEAPKASKKHWKPTKVRAPEVPTELQYLLPPPRPPEGIYSVFGEEQNLSSTLPTLASQSIPQLYSSPPATPTPGHSLNHAYYLTKIAKSILLSFLELTSLLAINPSEYAPKLEDLRHLFINAHHLINMYRPHQARETLITMMEERIEEGRREIEECDRIKIKTEQILKDLEEEGREVVGGEMNGGANGAHDGVEDAKTAEARKLWRMIHEEVDNGSTNTNRI